MQRWYDRVNEVKGTALPLAHAINKYGADHWTHEILFETDSLEEALAKEIEFIAAYGYYNVAKGGNGGNTGRNHEPEKIRKQAVALSKHWHALPEEEKQRRIAANIRQRIKNGTLGNSNPRTGCDHGQWRGNWIINGVKYTTLSEAGTATGLNQSTILDYCVRKTDRVYPRGSTHIRPGTTPRQNMCYKEEK